MMGRIEKVKDDIVLEEGAQLAIGGKEVEVVASNYFFCSVS